MSVCTQSSDHQAIVTVTLPHYGHVYACLFTWTLCMRVYESMSFLPQEALHQQSPEDSVEGKEESVCQFMILPHVCVPLVFLPSCLLSRGLNWGPERPINSKPARLFGMVNMWWQNIMFLSQPSPSLPPLTSPTPHPGDLLLACETTRVNSFPPGT